MRLVAGAALCEVDYYIQDASISTGLSSECWFVGNIFKRLKLI